jgi:hypothetical protein
MIGEAMASIHKNGKYWHVFFRLGGQQFKPSLKTSSERKAENLRGVVEDTIDALERGRLVLPSGAGWPEIIRFVLSGGRQTAPPKVSARPSLLVPQLGMSLGMPRNSGIECEMEQV